MPSQPPPQMRRLTPVKIHKELEAAFKGLQKTTIYFIDYVLKQGNKGSWRKKVLVCSANAVFLCDNNGSINRCIQFKHITKVMYGGVGDHVGMCVPSEDFDCLIRTRNLQYLLNVLRTLITDRRLEAGLSHPDFCENSQTATFPTDQLQLVKPTNWCFKLDDETLHCISGPETTPLETHSPSSPHQLHQYPESLNYSPVSPPGGHGVMGGGGGGGVPPNRQLNDIFDKLNEMQAEIKQLKAKEGSGDKATREMSLRSFEEVKAIRQELASEGIVAPSAAWGDTSPQGRHHPPVGTPGRLHGKEGFWVPANSPTARFRERDLETDDELPPGNVLQPSPIMSSRSGQGNQGSSARRRGKSAAVSCWHCRRDLTDVDPLPRCSVCRKAVYCGRQCQTVHWSKHKMECEDLAESDEDSMEEDDEDEEPEPPRPIYIVSPGGGMGGGYMGDRASPSPVRPFYAPELSKKKKTVSKRKPKIPPPPKFPPSPSHLSPDAHRDRVHSPSSSLPRADRPPPPPAPSAHPASSSDYDTLFNTYKEYYTNVLKGDTPSPPRT